MLAHYALFLAQALTIVIAILILFGGIIAISSKGKSRSKDRLEVKKINDKYEAMEQLLCETTCSKQELKRHHKETKKLQKEQKKSGMRKRIFVLNFQGDIRAQAVKNLREEITGILTTATPKDEVVLRLESPGGMVHAYGLAASQLQRLRKQQIPLTVIVDKIAASGGYMMAAVGNHILSAPFAVVGSIGVIAQIPNFHKLLKKKDIEFEQIMAGQYKRTLTLFGENTRQGREKFQEEVDETHALFKAFILENRPNLDMDKVATGEHWYGSRALELKLIDAIMTSDDYLLTASRNADIYEVCYQVKKTWMSKFSTAAQQGMEQLKANLKHVTPT
ncbi:MAG TPA: protease SohB [Gammaproteobacteria bacterium]|nr:protease SohB [Gammaproteobacteria bacterium]